MPGADDPADIARPLEAEFSQRLQCIGIIDVAGEHEIAGFTRQLLCLFEQRCVMRFDGLERPPEILGEGLAILVTHHAGHP
jgi:hypothetical protein